MKKYISVFLAAAVICTVLSGCGSISISREPDGELEVSIKTDGKLLDEPATIGEDIEISNRINSFEISWASGSVNIEYHDGDTVILHETSKDSTAEPLTWRVEGKKLYVNFSETQVSMLDGKNLTVTLPDGFRGRSVEINLASADLNADTVRGDEVDISTASGDVLIKCIEGNDISVNTASGSVAVAQNGTSDDVEISTASGDITASVESASDVSMDTASGDIGLILMNAAECDLETASGDITLAVPQILGFKAEIETSSGELNSDLALKQSGKAYSFGDGKMTLEIETASGDVFLKEAK